MILYRTTWRNMGTTNCPGASWLFNPGQTPAFVSKKGDRCLNYSLISQSLTSQSEKLSALFLLTSLS